MAERGIQASVVDSGGEGLVRVGMSLVFNAARRSEEIAHDWDGKAMKQLSKERTGCLYGGKKLDGGV
jgi:hypothetical protein